MGMNCGLMRPWKAGTTYSRRWRRGHVIASYSKSRGSFPGVLRIPRTNVDPLPPPGHVRFALSIELGKSICQWGGEASLGMEIISTQVKQQDFVCICGRWRIDLYRKGKYTSSLVYSLQVVNPMKSNEMTHQLYFKMCVMLRYFTGKKSGFFSQK